MSFSNRYKGFCLGNNSGGGNGMTSIADSGGGNSVASIASITDSSNSGSSSNSSNWGGSSNRDMRDSVDRGSVSSHDSLAGVSLDGGVVDVGSLNDFLDGVNLVGSWDMDGTWDGNLIRLCNMGDLDDLTGNGTWDGNGDIDVVFLDIDLWDNVGDLRGDSGVGSDGSSDLGLDNGVSRSWASWDRGRWDGSIRCWGSRDGWRGKSNSLNEVLGFSSNIGMGRLGDGLLSSNGVSMSSNNLLDSGLDSPLSDNSVLNTVLNYWGSSSIAVVGLSNNSWGTGNWSSNKSSTSIAHSTDYSMSIVSLRHGSPIGTGHEGASDHKSVHVCTALFRRDSPA